MSDFLNALAVLGLALLALLSAGEADAYESDWCAVTAREAVIVLRITDPDYATADRDALDILTSRLWSRCLLLDEPPTMADLGVSLKGVVPAGEVLGNPEPLPDAARIAACWKAYRSFRASDMTVVRRGGKGKRVPCPL